MLDISHPHLAFHKNLTDFQSLAVSHQALHSKNDKGIIFIYNNKFYKKIIRLKFDILLRISYPQFPNKKTLKPVYLLLPFNWLRKEIHVNLWRCLHWKRSELKLQ